MKFREMYGMQIAVLCLLFLGSLFWWGCFEGPGDYMRGSFYHAQVSKNITTAYIMAFAYFLNALAYALPAKMERKYLVGVGALVGLLNIVIALIYFAAVAFAWFSGFATRSIIFTILLFPFYCVPSLILFLLSLPLLYEAYKKCH
jgi:hypothetical protein